MEAGRPERLLGGTFRPVLHILSQHNGEPVGESVDNRLRTAYPRQNRYAGVVLVSLCILALAVSSAAAPPPSGEYTLSVLETTPGFFDVPLYAMMHEGFAKANHLTLTLAQFQTGSGSSSTIFAGGTGDILMGGMDAPVRLQQSKTVNITVIGVMLQHGVFVLVSKAGSPYQTLQSLKGQVVGISGPGSFNDFALRLALKKNGMNPSDVQIAALGGTPAQYAAVESGNAAAVQLQSPILENALNQHTVQPIYDFRTEQGLQAALVFTARAAAVKANPAAYAAFMRSYRQVMQKFRTDGSYATKVATEEWGGSTPPANIQIQLDTYLRSPGIWSLDGVFTVVMYNNTRELLLGSGQFTETDFPSFKQLNEYAPLLQ
jgi:NitT/TauT family transport system substrate-binding protein